MMQEDMGPYMTQLLTQLISKLAAVSKVCTVSDIFIFFIRRSIPIQCRSDY